MDFPGICPLELFFILYIALVIIGPRDIVKAARSTGRFLNRLYKSEMWRTLTEASRNLRTLPDRLAREAALEELVEVRRSIEETGEDLAQDVKSLDEDLRAMTTPIPEPESSPTDPKPLAEDQTDHVDAI